MKAIYIGAGTDVRPIKFFKEIKNFYYFDGQPNSEFGTKLSGTITKDGFNGYSRPNFISNLDQEMNAINMKLEKVNDNLRTYSNNDKKVYYYTNTAIPEHYQLIEDKIKNFDTLIVAGHDPDSCFLNATDKKINFIGAEGTYYGNNEFESNNSIIYKMYNNDIHKKFTSFSYIKRDGRVFNFNSWDDYISYFLKDNRRFKNDKRIWK